MSSNIFVCVKDLVIVHRTGPVYRYKAGQTISESTLIRQGTNPNTEYFERKNNGSL